MKVNGQGGEAASVTAEVANLTIALCHLHRRNLQVNLLCRRHYVARRGGSFSEVICRLERYAAANLQWAEENAVRFETTKTEAILLSEKRKH